MFRQLLAAFVTATFLFVAPAVLTPQAQGVYAVAAAAADDDDDKSSAKKRRIPHNKKVGLNVDTKVFHDKTCRHFTKKLTVMSAKEAKAKGGKPCKVCLK